MEWLERCYDPAKWNWAVTPRGDGLARTDQQAIAQAIGSGGESAFGSRAGLAAGDRAEAVGRGLAKEIGGIRSRGYQQAQSAAMGEFGRQQGAKRQAAGALPAAACRRPEHLRDGARLARATAEKRLDPFV